ncbi:MAG: ATP-binding protein [Candidatus Methylomirabilia bacterium]
MGHIVGKDIYRNLGAKVDNITIRAPWNEKFRALLTALYTPEEAELVVRMPYGLSDIDRVAGIARVERGRLEGLLDGLCEKGLVLDLEIEGVRRYAPNPLMIGIFEFTMMRAGNDAGTKEWAGLFHAYLQGDPQFWEANRGCAVSPIRALPHEAALAPAACTEILDYERASAIVEGADRFAIGLCSCRHTKHHVGEKKCATPLDTCSSFGGAADYLIRHKMAREVGKPEMRENLARSRELGLVLSADNVKRGVTFLCQCCACCCEPIQGITRSGWPQALVSSNFAPIHDKERCEGCGRCVLRCAVRAITMVPAERPRGKKRKEPRIDADRCIGCGVCGLKCESRALDLVKRSRRVLTPESTFERVILQCLEQGTLANQLFDNPQSKTQAWLRGFVGGFLRLAPVKKALLGDSLRSRFLAAMTAGAQLQGKGWGARM